MNTFRKTVLKCLKKRQIISNFSSLLLLFTFVFAVSAQAPLEFGPASMATVPDGPTSEALTARLLLNTTGTTFTTPSTTLMVTASVGNQQFTGSGTVPGDPVLFFGGTISDDPEVSGLPTFSAMNSVGGPANTMFSNDPAGTATGIAVATNRAFSTFLSIRHWAETDTPPTDGRYYMADMTITFSSPVTNPYLHISGLGGFTSTDGDIDQTFSAEFEMATPGLTFTALQGVNLDVTATTINNSSAQPDTPCTAGAGCGTVRVNGTNITSFTLRTYVRGGNPGGTNWGFGHSGDRYVVAVSVPQALVLSGNVFNDTTNDGTVNGSPINSAGAPLFANLIDPTDGSVIGSVAIAPDGTYSFDGIPANTNLEVRISTNPGTALEATPANALGPSWGYRNENVGAGAGTDGSPDGILPVSIGTTNVTDVNFGIVQALTAANVSVGGVVLTADGRGIKNVSVKMNLLDGSVRTAITGPFGYYRFDDVQVGQSAVISVTAKRYTFNTSIQVVSVDNEIGDLVFVSNE